MIGKVVSHYQIIEKLGEGGMGEVYKAEDTKLQRIAALKFLPREFTRDEEAQQRFIQEARAASALDHSNIETIYEIGECDGDFFIAMAYYEGETLKEKIASCKGGLEVEEAIGITIQIAQGLTRAHSKNIVHRDLKPANIMITKEGEVKIIDFGLAKLKGHTMLTKAGTTMGTVAYMAPEQVEGKEVDERIDIWSLGVLMYEMMTGDLPFRGDYDQVILYSIVYCEPKPLPELRPELPNQICRIVEKALAKSPEDRYQRMEDLLSDLTYSELQDQNQIPVQHQPSVEERRTIQSLAVLPLQNLSRDPEQEYFADGMTEALITELAKLGSIKVISRTSTTRYKETDLSLPQIAVSYMLMLWWKDRSCGLINVCALPVS